jgi:hypothetical protein
MKKPRRAGMTQTFSVSVDPETKRALRSLAEQDFGGNLSALVTDRRRMAADAYLRRHGISIPTKAEADALQKEISREASVWQKRSRKRTVHCGGQSRRHRTRKAKECRCQAHD